MNDENKDHALISHIVWMHECRHIFTVAAVGFSLAGFGAIAQSLRFWSVFTAES